MGLTIRRGFLRDGRVDGLSLLMRWDEGAEGCARKLSTMVNLLIPTNRIAADHSISGITTLSLRLSLYL